MTHLLSMPVVLLSCLCVEQPAATADDGFDLLPADASLIVRLNAPQSTLEDLATFVNKVQPGVGGIVSGQAGLLGMAIANPTLESVFMDSDWYAAIYTKPVGPPDVVLLIPTDDADKAKKAVNPGYEFAVKGRFIAYSKSADKIRNVEACFSGDVAPISSLLDERQRKMLSSGHLSVFANGGQLKSVFADQLEGADEQLNELVEKIASQVPAGHSQQDLAYIWDMYREFGGSVLQAVRDSEALVVRVEATDDALQIEHFLSVSKGSTTDTMLHSQPPGDLTALTSLPQGQSSYFGAHGNMAPFVAYVDRMMTSIPLDEKARAQFEKSYGIMKEIQFGSLVGGGGLQTADDDGIRYFGISEVSPASKIREAFAGLEAGAEYEIAGIKQRQSYQPDAETIDGISVDIFKIKQTIPPELDPLGMQQAIQEKLHGPNGMTQRIVTKGDKLYNTLGGGIDSMKQLLSSEPWTDSNLLDARSRMPKQANLLFLVDIPSTLQQFFGLIVSTETIPIPLTKDQLDNLKIARSYAGFSVTAEPQHVLLHSSIPIETFQGFAQIVFFIRQLRAGGI